MSPQSSPSDFDKDGLNDLSELTEAEREVYLAVEGKDVGVCELARSTVRYYVTELEDQSVLKRLGNPVLVIYDTEALWGKTDTAGRNFVKI